jgi:nicotinamide-nucleotide amidase
VTGSRFDPELFDHATRLIKDFAARGKMIATVESCTGGLVAGLLTEVAGSSAVVDRGFVTYSNEAKTDLVGVPRELILASGAVSAPVARAMAEGALARSRADVTIAITGVAGPGGGTPDKPVGLVHLASALRGGETIHVEKRFGDLGRSAVRRAAILTALEMLAARAEN